MIGMQALSKEAVPHEQARENVLQRVKDLLSKLTWKHALVGVLPLVIYLYPRPLIRLFMPIASKLNRNHPPVACQNFVREIILTTNSAITRDNISSLETTKGTTPNWTSYRDEEIAVIELYGKENIGSPFSSQSVVLTQANEAELTLYSEALWTNYRLTRLERPHLRAILIKSSQEMLRNFLLKFYKMDKGESHKLGFFGDYKLSILRLDERVGTYEHLSCEFASLRNTNRLK